MAEDNLTEKQKKFIEAYAGNATEAAKMAGYSAPGQAACDLLKLPKIAKAIREREEKRIRPLIMSRAERQEFWSSIIKNEEEQMSARLKASELLGRSECDFIERREISGSLDVSVWSVVDAIEGDK